MKIILKLLEILSYLYWLQLPHVVGQSVWQSVKRGEGTGINQIARGLLMVDAWCFFIPIGGEWSGYEIRKLLRAYGIDFWGWGFANGELYFHVHKEDALLAEQVMWEAGIPLT